MQYGKRTIEFNGNSRRIFLTYTQIVCCHNDIDEINKHRYVHHHHHQLQYQQ